MRKIKSVIFKRIHLGRKDDLAGHWWFEIGDVFSRESYGWYPAAECSWIDLFVGVRGVLNAGESYDPHHGEEADEVFHPVVNDGDNRSDKQIAVCLRDFAKNFEGKWRWFIGWGPNCHTFQREALMHCQLAVPRHIRKAKL